MRAMVLLVFLLVACATPDLTPADTTNSPRLSPTTAGLPPSTTPRGPRMGVVTPRTTTPRPTPAVSHTSTPYRTATPRPTSTLVPPVLMEPDPAIQDLLLLLLANHHIDYAFELEHLQHFDANVYQKVDVDGDGQKEILLAGGGMYIDLIPFFAIFTYQPTGWTEKFYLGWGGKEAQVRATLRENRLQVDFLTHHTAGGLNDISWHQFWIRCEAERCWEIWSAEVYTDFWTGLGPTQLYSIATIEEPSPGTVRRTTRGISIESTPSDRRQTPPAITGSGRCTIHPEVVETYVWDGEQYVLSRREESRPYPKGDYLAEINRQSHHTLVGYFTRPDGSVDEEALSLVGILVP